MTLEILRETVSRLSLSTSALAALGAALDARVTGRELDPSLAPHVDGVLAALGAGESIAAATPAQLLPLLLRVVGIDPWGPALLLARENVRRNGFDTRIELREQAAETLSDTERFDLAWIPSLFLPERVVPATLERVRRALRPDGWLLFAALKPSLDPLTAALASFRTALFGGLISTPEKVEALLRAKGFTEVRTLPSTPAAVAAIIVARCAP
jgi:SAM-dependent methyltransferase